MLQQNYVCVEKPVVQVDGPVLPQVVGQLLPRQEAGGAEQHPLRGLRLREADPVVGEGLPRLQGQIEARVTAQAEIHGLLILIPDPVADVEAVFLQPIADLIAEAEGVDVPGLGVVLHDHRAFQLALLLLPQHRVADEAVVPQGVAFAPVGIFPAPEPGHVGEDIHRPALPEGRVPLPEIFRAVGSADGPQLSPQGVDFHRQLIVVKQHGSFLLLDSAFIISQPMKKSKILFSH